MVDALNKLKKLRGSDWAELRVRGTQALAARAESYGWSAQARVPEGAAFRKLFDASRLSVGGGHVSDENLLAHFRARRESQFFAGFSDREGTVAELRRRFPAAEAAVLERAARAGEGRFDLLGFKDLHFGAPPDWHLEPVSGRRAPRKHWSRIEYLDAQVTGDKKIIWELNRQQYFTTLGRAYWYTRDERHAQIFAAHLESWMTENPPKIGVNWASSLEVAFRAISWLWALHFFRDAHALTPALYARTLKYLYLHARHLETYLSTYFSPNTHLTGEAIGLFYLGTLLPEFRRAARWRATGLSILLDALPRHVQADGVYFEQASYYQRYTADFYTHLFVLLGANGQPAPAPLAEKLRALLDHLMWITRPDGTTPFFGDDDGGRFVMLDERPPNDFRAALSTGAALFGDAGYKYVAGEAAEETLWLLGAAGVGDFDALAAAPPEATSRAFPVGGYYVMRDGWRPDSNYLLLDAGPHGTANCGHAHADALSFELAARGRTLLVDPGTYNYTGDSTARDEFRSSAAHNTLGIDGVSSSVPAGPFSWRHIANARARDWKTHARFDYFEGAHDGYARLASPAEHARSVLFVKGDYWIMRDRVATTGAHDYALHFHFAPDAVPEIETHPECARLAVRAAAEGGMADSATPRLQVYTFAGGADGEWHEREGWVSACYGTRTPAPVRVFDATATGAQDFITFLIPPPATDGAARVRELEATGGRAFEIECGADWRDVLLLGDGSYVESAWLASDFAWSWARFSEGGSQLEELVLIGGRRLSLRGREIVGLPERAAYLVARRVGDQLLIETDAGNKSVALGGLSAVLDDLEDETDGRLVSPAGERR
ncbi:MAG TPA: alginate lyase family protein [Pyrinomonadaceae bacterium]|nr:alginate lyase family protein [Pyrinomonadaceae bacterium]